MGGLADGREISLVYWENVSSKELRRFGGKEFGVI